MLAPVSLSEVLARVCFKTWDISTILLPGGAMWVFLAILALFMAPSTRTHKHTWAVKKRAQSEDREEGLMPDDFTKPC